MESAGSPVGGGVFGYYVDINATYNFLRGEIND